MSVIPNAIDERFRVPPPDEEARRIRERFQLHEPFVLYAGNVKPHKNVERLIEAFYQLHANGFDHLKLLIIGNDISKYATLRRAIHAHNLHKYVRFLGFVPDQTLAILYRLASVFVFPSLYEGFGLPPLEAMASGTPVVTSNVSSLPEVVGTAAVLVDPHDAHAIAEGIAHVLYDPRLREDLRRRGLARAATFSWETAAREVRAIYGGGRRREARMRDRGRRRRRRRDAICAGLRVALVHDWLTGMRGGERVLRRSASSFRVHISSRCVHVPGAVSATIASLAAARSSFVERLPRALALVSPLSAALPRRRRAVRPRRLRPGDLEQPLRGEVGGRARAGPASLLLPLADALRVGSVQRLLRARCGSAGRAAPPARCSAGWPAGTATPAAALTAIWLILNMLHNGSADTIIGGPSSCRPPSIPPSTRRPPTRASLSAGRRHADRYFLVVSALVPYKRLELAIEASRQVNVPLKVVGEGTELGTAAGAGRAERGVSGPSNR